MSQPKIQPTGKERFLGEEEIIVSKTDLRGRILYSNDVFWRISGYTEAELIGQPHSLIRHPDMPRCVFKLLWDTIQSGREIFAYVVNLCKNGDHYWVFAHVTPSFDEKGAIVGYHSNRRAPDRAAVDTAGKLYKALREEEAKYSDSRKGMEAGVALLLRLLGDKKVEYDEFVFSLSA